MKEILLRTHSGSQEAAMEAALESAADDRLREPGGEK
jgi:hypothetical protein